MERNENFPRYDDVNKEIQKILASKEERATRGTEHNYDRTPDILTLLEALNRTYSEINMALKTENSQALKDVILKSDIKMSMVCETLLETLRKTVEDKDRISKENQALEREKRELENREASLKIQLSKTTTELEFKKRNVEELNRVIKDQKDRMSELKDDAQKSKNDTLFYKAKINELENLRARANEKLMLYEKEMEALGEYIKQKDQDCALLLKEKKDEENKNSSVKTKALELESLVEILNKKIESRDKNLSLCNSELSKLLCENKKLKVDYERFKESSFYYEGLYNSTNTQNAYLNSELNKMLKKAEYSKDIDGYVMKYKKKNKKLRKKMKALEKELNEIKNCSNEVALNTNPDETSDSLMKKIEDLTKRNEEYKKKLNSLEEEKASIEQRVRSLNISRKHDFNLQGEKYDDYGKQYGFTKGISLRNGTMPSNDGISAGSNLGFKNYASVRSDNRDRDGYEPVNKYSNKQIGDQRVASDVKSSFEPQQSYFSSDRFKGFGTDYRTKDNYGLQEAQTFSGLRGPSSYFTNNKTFKDIAKPEAAPKKSNETYLKLFNLENNYDEVSKNDFAGGFADDSDIPKSNLEINYDVDDKKEEDFYIKDDKPIPTSQINNNSGTYAKQVKLPAKQFEDEHSAESIKTYHTSSTLKEMMAKTENLQKKFQVLEDQLANINEGGSIDKLTDKIKTYNSYYSDLNADSNESDYL